MYNVIMYNVQCTMYNVQCIMYNVQCTCKNIRIHVEYRSGIIRCLLDSEYFIYSIYTIQCTIFTIQCTIYTIQYTLYIVCLYMCVRRTHDIRTLYDVYVGSVCVGLQCTVYVGLFVTVCLCTIIFVCVWVSVCAGFPVRLTYVVWDINVYVMAHIHT